MLTGMDGVMKGTRARQKWVAVVQAVQYYDALYSSDRMDRCADVVISHLTPGFSHTTRIQFSVGLLQALNTIEDFLFA